jgi:hypothetical protein
MPLENDYEWVSAADDTLNAFCLSVMVPGDIDRVARGFNIDPNTALEANLREAWALVAADPAATGNNVVQIGSIGAAIVIVEPNGWTGVDASVAQRLSDGGAYAAVYDNGNGAVWFVYAKDGVMRRTFDAVLYDDVDAADGPSEEHGLPLGTERCRAGVFMLIERLMSIGIEEEWLLRSRRRTFRRAD